MQAKLRGAAHFFDGPELGKGRKIQTLPSDPSPQAKSEPSAENAAQLTMCPSRKQTSRKPMRLISVGNR
jgi:hypothetical protein